MDDALNVWKFRASLSEFDGWLRNKIKYTEGIPQDYQDIRDELHRIMQENGVEV